MFEEIINNDAIKAKHRTFIQLYYIEGVRSSQQAKEYGIPERTYYRRIKEVHYIIQQNWQQNSQEPLQSQKEKIDRVIVTFI